jgi:16S rRNA (cytidine1402-2'-O)-methyltransferase
MGDRHVVVARELTKIYEEFIRGTVSETIAAVAQGKARGEVVILIAAGNPVQVETEPLAVVLKDILSDERVSVKDAAKIAARITGSSRGEAYAEAIKLRNDAG